MSSTGGSKRWNMLSGRRTSRQKNARPHSTPQNSSLCSRFNFTLLCPQMTSFHWRTLWSGWRNKRSYHADVREARRGGTAMCCQRHPVDLNGDWWEDRVSATGRWLYHGAEQSMSAWAARSKSLHLASTCWTLSKHSTLYSSILHSHNLLYIKSCSVFRELQKAAKTFYFTSWNSKALFTPKLVRTYACFVRVKPIENRRLTPFRYYLCFLFSWLVKFDATNTLENREQQKAEWRPGTKLQWLLF